MWHLSCDKQFWTFLGFHSPEAVIVQVYILLYNIISYCASVYTLIICYQLLCKCVYSYTILSVIVQVYIFLYNIISYFASVYTLINIISCYASVYTLIQYYQLLCKCTHSHTILSVSNLDGEGGQKNRLTFFWSESPGMVRTLITKPNCQILKNDCLAS